MNKVKVFIDKKVKELEAKAEFNDEYETGFNNGQSMILYELLMIIDDLEDRDSYLNI